MRVPNHECKVRIVYIARQIAKYDCPLVPPIPLNHLFDIAQIAIGEMYALLTRRPRLVASDTLVRIRVYVYLV